MELTPEIVAIYVLLVLTLVSFAWEKIPADLTAMTLFAIILVTGLLPHERAWDVFANPAPITVGAMFILSAALSKCGAIDTLARSMESMTRMGFTWFVFFMLLVVASISAFINNTPVVVVFMPVVLSLAKKLDVPASKLLIPLSYASIFGGTCTLIGTSTNILVSGIGQSRGLDPFGMFEISKVGVPILFIGILYILLFGRRMLPVRETLTSILSEDERREYITEAFVQHDSPLTGKTVADSQLTKVRGVRVMEIVRDGVAVPGDLNQATLETGDRLVLACRPSGIAHARNLEGIDFVAESGLGLEQIAAHEGLLVEGVIGVNSALIGKTIREINFRQRYRVIILAIHRRGKNLREQLETLRLEFGDTLLMLGTDRAVNNLRSGEDIMLIDRPPVPAQNMRKKMPIVLAAIAGVVASATLGIVPIEVAAVAAVVLIFLTGCLKPAEGYNAIQWNILFIIFGMLGMGLAMEETGAARYLAISITASVQNNIPEDLQPIFMLGCVYLLTTLLTEILSNNAAAVLIAVLSFSIAATLEVDPRPFLIAVAIAASASFATPIGYQTNTYVYGVGGYRFTDFVKFGVPLNLLYFVGAMILIPLIWSF
jgi:di/tricarboxylate transporter